MEKKSRWFRRVMLGGLCLVLLSGCGNNSSDKKEDETQESESGEDEGGTKRKI